MKSRFLHIVAVGLTVAATLSAATPSQAFFGLFQPRYTTAAPPTYPAYCGACPQTVQYVPQTCFRTQTTSVPVTTLRPVSVIDPCTGCVQTIMQPTTSIVQQVRFIPYQSFRIVQRPTIVAAPIATTVQFAPQCAATCGTTQACASPVLATASFAAAPMASSGCSTCGVSAATFTSPAMNMPLSASHIGSTMPQIPTAVAPSLSSDATYSTPGAATTTYGAVPSVGPTTPAPSLSPIIVRSPTTLNGTTTTITQSPTTTTGTTVIGSTTTTVPATSTPAATAPTTAAPAPAATETQSPVTPTPSTKLVPIPDLRFTPEAKPTTGTSTPTTSTPGLVDPNSRTTMLPSARPWSSTLVSWPTRRAAAEVPTKVDPAAPTANDWRPSNR